MLEGELAAVAYVVNCVSDDSRKRLGELPAADNGQGGRDDCAVEEKRCEARGGHCWAGSVALECCDFWSDLLEVWS